MKKRFEPVNTKIVGLHKDGYGITDDPRLCVHGALAGEDVTALPFTRKKQKIFAKTTEIHKASDDRCEPMCSVAADCGGCSLQHYDPLAQIKHKQSFLFDTLADTQPSGYFSPLTGPVSHYRAKGRLGVKYVDKKERVLVGFREKLKPYITEATNCCVLKKPVSDLLESLARLIEGFSDPRTLPQIEVAMGDADAALVFRHLNDLDLNDLEQLKSFGAAHQLHVYLQPGNLATVHKIWPADGIERLEYALPDFDLTFEFHPMDFTQINPEINRKMVAKAIEYLDVNDADCVFDAFCGIGNFSLAVARRAKHVIGIEASIPSVERAKVNAAKNALHNTEFHVADLFAEGLDIPALQQANKVLLDPPRSGAFEVCKKLASSKVERVVYVSCNPETLARDAEILVASGYQFEGAGVIDMFPHTTHVESIACFSR
ncbi:MAG: 23S rRNA (uracil(1939)-C(5))-methyltransferase RlmD [Pseudomonadales bacterium]|nr:23S rRNA (uracil(1939)-C(5))-methyltransferase RlmD [Pseudomonadales bacterium]MDG1442115.1 23S rRNA (uracil(1939)-C(5))-methyltransferase RlmD [Pseudomonadales bacterium]